MQTRHFALGIALLLLITIIGAAQAKTLQVHCKGAGTGTPGVETNIDTDGDGASASLDQGLVNCNIARFFFQEEGELILQPTVTTCPPGTDEELHIDSTQGQQRGVWTDEKTEDQLFLMNSQQTLCLHASTLPLTFTSSGQTEAIGGTGKYAGATGTIEFHATGSYLQFGFNGISGAFGGLIQFTSSDDGTLNLPKAGDDKQD